MTDEISHKYMHFGNGGLQLTLKIREGVLGIEAEHHQFGVPSLASFIPLLYDEKHYEHHFDRSYSSGIKGPNGAYIRTIVPKDPNDNSNNDTLFLWLHAELEAIKQWLDKNPSGKLSDYQILAKLKAE